MERILLSLQTVAAVAGAAASYLLGGIDNLILFLQYLMQLPDLRPFR